MLIKTDQKSAIPPPSAYGLPAKFDRWRPHQDRAVERVINSQSRFTMTVAPTGAGKSCQAESVARHFGRSAYLTITKPLQNQIEREFSDRFDIRGKSNFDRYPCAVLNEAGNQWPSVEVAEHAGLCDGCALKDRGCRYYDDMRRAKRENYLLTNYAKWLSTPADQLGEFDCLILDEAHGAADQICKHLRIELAIPTIDRFAGPAGPVLSQNDGIEGWRRWALRVLSKLTPLYETLRARVAAGEKQKLTEARQLGAFLRQIEKLSQVSTAATRWIEDRSGDVISFEPLWPSDYGERLFRGIKKIDLWSATVSKKDAQLLGIAPDQLDYAEYPSSFPIERRPVIYVPTVTQRFGMSDDEKMDGVRRVDQLISARLDRRGIIHSGSFDRARFIKERSQYRALILTNDPHGGRSTAEVVDQYLKTPPPVVLCGPSFEEGWDFAYEACEWQNIYKIPLINRHASEVEAERCKDDPEYDGSQAMKRVMQIAGRIVRAEDDQGETIITDDTWGKWFYRQNCRFAAQWFLRAVRGPEPLPRPMEKLRGRQ